MAHFNPTWTHGDAASTNFFFLGDGGVIAIDWERLKVADPTANIGRLERMLLVAQSMASLA